MGFQSGINRLLGMGAAISTAKKATELASQKAEYNESMQQVKLQTAQEKLKNVKLQNKNLRFKNKALKNMQDIGVNKVENKNSFDSFLEELKGKGVSEKYIAENKDYLKLQYKEKK